MIIDSIKGAITSASLKGTCSYTTLDVSSTSFKQEKEKLYVELKQILARQPGHQVAEQLQSYQQKLKEKTKEMKSLASELNMYESQASRL